MSTAEKRAKGTIQFAYNLAEPEQEIVPEPVWQTMLAWRRVLRQLNLIGQTDERYGGLGFGNFSAKLSDADHDFVISASQTSGTPALTPTDMVRITSCNLQRFWVEAQGVQPPSSETLTHGMVYAADRHIRWIFHCHNPEIWQNADALGLPSTGVKVPYGSLAMVRSVAELLTKNYSRPLVFTTRGHEDGIFACGPTARDTAGLLISYLAKAYELQLAS